MKKQKLYVYLAIALIVIPFLGIYQYIKDALFILFGCIILLSRIKISKKSTHEKHVSETAARAVRRPRVVMEQTVTEGRGSEKI
ncbi:MAG: hypothetical protein RI996_96 [Candidatus Parcubacteria bacterium]|jgi:hypothetical protein